ncbi:uncharacterized protein [Spinacia oleracea]|uniref:Uncharacterized protein n=1 Tax=Spinacia oleracea TaxID=3562 RepID=A0ABM3RSH4_SPIOL|nr:uncharacterized protein LOC130472133 [Spinacia oleracea]
MPGFMEELDNLMANEWNMYYEQRANEKKIQSTPRDAQIHEVLENPEDFITPRLDIPTPRFRTRTPTPEPEIPSEPEIMKPAIKTASNETPEATRTAIAKYTSFNLLSPSPINQEQKAENPEHNIVTPASPKQ